MIIGLKEMLMNVNLDLIPQNLILQTLKFSPFWKWKELIKQLEDTKKLSKKKILRNWWPKEVDLVQLEVLKKQRKMLLLRNIIMVDKLKCKLPQDNQFMIRKNLWTLRLCQHKLNRLLKIKNLFMRTFQKKLKRMQQHLLKRANHQKLNLKHLRNMKIKMLKT